VLKAQLVIAPGASRDLKPIPTQALAHDFYMEMKMMCQQDREDIIKAVKRLHYLRHR